MKLKDYIKSLKKLIKDNPDCAEYVVIYSKDDEGNAFHKVHHEPTIGHFGECDFIPEPSKDDGQEAEKEWLENGNTRNSVVIN